MSSFGATGNEASEVNRLHDLDDVDLTELSHHHTLGIASGQSSPGPHIHDGKTSKKISYTSITGTPTIPVASGTVTDERPFGIAPAAGAAATFSKGDHTHGSPVAPTVFEGPCSADLTLGTSNADITGMSVTVNPAGSNSIIYINATVWFRCSVTVAASDLIGELFIAGVAQAGLILGDGANANRQNASNNWAKVVANGSKIIKVQGRKSNAGITAVAGQTHSRLTVLLFDF